MTKFYNFNKYSNFQLLEKSWKLQQTIDRNIKLINRLLVLTEAQEESLEKGKRLAMLRRNAKSNYIIIVNLDYIMKAKCTSENCAPN